MTKETEMKLLAATAMSLTLTAPAFAQEAPAIEIARSGSQPSRQGPAENFTGSVRVDPLFAANGPARASGAYVTFQPGAHTAWHTHPLGQILIVTAGTGRVQGWGGPVQEMSRGDVVRIPPGLKHWHGASPGSTMTHIAIQEHVDGKTVDWLEKVSDAQYGELPPASTPVQPTRAQKLFGDINPKLAELTDNVLFGDVWARPGLSRRDRSLATVSALIAMNRPDQLRSHLALALENGVTKEELVEAITHLAFYSGWPNAINAALVAKEVLQ
jgi:4-carboxymuconolactone decarboxylase